MHEVRERGGGRRERERETERGERDPDRETEVGRDGRKIDRDKQKDKKSYQK